MKKIKMSCATLILWNSCHNSHRKTINTKIIEIGVVPPISSKILGFGPELRKPMYFLGFLWKLTNFGSQFLHNRWSDLSQILNLSLFTIISWPKKFQVNPCTCARVRVINVRVTFQNVDAMMIVDKFQL